MIVDCIQRSVTLGHLLRKMESQRTTREETSAVDWKKQRRDNCKGVDVRSGHFAGNCLAGARRWEKGGSQHYTWNRQKKLLG